MVVLTYRNIIKNERYKEMGLPKGVIETQIKERLRMIIMEASTMIEAVKFYLREEQQHDEQKAGKTAGATTQIPV